MSLRALTDGEVVAAFGDPTPHMKQDGTISRSWEQEIVRYFDLPAPLPLAWSPTVAVTRVKAHKRIARLLQDALDMIYNHPPVWKTINDFGGVYEWRRQRGARSLSRHCWAIAIDLDVRDNPMDGRPETSEVHPLAIEIMEAHGFIWGGRFEGKRSDPMHWEFADLTRL